MALNWIRPGWWGLALLSMSVTNLAQERAAQEGAAQEGVRPEAGEADETRPEFEAEFVASDIFRSGSLTVPLFRRFSAEGQYFGGTNTDTGYTGIGVTFGWRGLRLMPGFGVTFGSNRFTTSPAVSLRWEYEKKWFVTQGLAVQSFRSTPIFEEDSEADGENEPVGFVRPTISDGNHVSVRWRRLTAGGTWEHIAFREGDEWKGGGRVAVRLFPNVSAILYVLGPPATEWRGGLLFHAKQKED